MSSNWPKVRLGDYCIKIGSGATPKGGKKVYLDEGEISLIRSQNVYNEGFSSSGLVYITNSAADKLRNVEVQERDILINITGDSVARVCMAPREYLPARVNQHVAIIRVDPTEFNPNFVRYFLSTSEQQRLLLTIASAGATRNALTKSQIENLEIIKPNLEKQAAIAQQLSSLEDKIKVNNQVNQTLEQIAQAIFKSWFVDFEPVKAKISALTAGGSEEDALLAAMQAISGKDKAQLTQLQTDNPEHYNQLRTTAELFPSAMQDSELGEIPEGWRLDHIENLCEKVESGGTPKRSIPQYWGGNIKWLSSGEVRKSIVIETKETISIQGLQSSSAKVWPKLSTVIAMYGATAGQVCLLADDMATNQACCGLVPKQNHAALLYFSARNSIAELSGKASGSAQQNLNKGIVANHNVTIPSCEIATKFENSIIPIITTLIHNSLESSSLEQTRDALLPKLLSGELRFESKIYSDANYAMTSGHDEKVDSCS